MEGSSDHIPADSIVIVSGVAYTLSVLRIKELIELQQFCKGKIIEQAKRAAANLPIVVQTELMRDALSLADKLELHTDKFIQAIDRLESYAFAFYLMAKRNHADMTAEKALDLFGQSLLTGPEAAQIITLLKASLGLEVNPTQAAAL